MNFFYKRPLLILTTISAFAWTSAFANNPSSKSYKKSDNTSVNKRDSSGNTLTPMDQARGSDADVELTRSIREQITRDNALSTYAKNVKIVTLNQSVTLRGPVASAAEKQKIETHVRNVAPAGTRIQNLLEISDSVNAR